MFYFSKNLRNGFLGSIGLASLCALSSCQTPRKKPVKKTNFLFVLVDDMGWSDLGCYGSTFHETPNIDQLATEGVRFTNAYAACPVCSPTRASIMSGKYPARINVTDWIPGRQHWGAKPFEQMKQRPFNHQLALEEETIAEALKENGYSTCFLGKWHLGEEEKYWPEWQGFDINLGGHAGGSPRAKGGKGYFSPYNNPRLSDGPEGEYLTDRLTNEAIKYIETHKDSSFFVYLSYYTVHTPMEGKKEYVERFKAKADSLGLSGKEVLTRDCEWIHQLPPGHWKERLNQGHATYASMVYSLDENVGRLLKRLKELGLDEETVVFFMSDNGGLSTAEGSVTSNAPLRAGKGWLYEGGIREPMIIKWPGVATSGSTCDVPVTSTDFYPTILEMAGVPLLPEQHKDGKSMVNLLKGQKGETRPLFWHYPHYSNQGGRPGAAVRLGDYKLIEFFENGEVELYNLKEDISETRDLRSEMPEKVAQLKKLLHDWQTEVGAIKPVVNPGYNPNFVTDKWEKFSKKK